MDKVELHKTISYVKSAMRLAGYVALIFNVITGATVLFIAELLGIAEELYGA